MEFNLNTQLLFKCDRDGFSCLQGKNTSLNKNSLHSISSILDEVGEASAQAQGLKVPITNGLKFFGSDHTLYIKCDGKRVIGFLKMGVKRLFIRDEVGGISDISPLCVLDFYVEESQQRNGIGKALFEKMLKSEGVLPHKLGFDRPSEKLIRFLCKHYSLTQYVPQNNNFVVFTDYFSAVSTVSTVKRSLNVYQKKSVTDIDNKFLKAKMQDESKPKSNCSTTGISFVSSAPWATDSSSNFAPTSSSYGAYYAVNKR